MSTKIFNGYKLPQMSLKELDLFIKKSKGEIRKAYIELGESMLIRKSIRLLDLFYIHGGEYVNEILNEDVNFNSHYSPYFLAHSDLVEDSRNSEKSGMLADSIFDLKSSICLFPVRGKILAMLFSQQRQFTSVWDSIEGVEEYCYWNNSDKPEDLSDSQWNRRKQDWDTALTGIGIPSECGFIVELTKGFPSLFDMKLKENASKYISTIDSLDTRASTYARNIVFNEQLDKNMEGIDKENSNDVRNSTYKWLNTDDAKNSMVLKTEELKIILIPEITLDMLKTKFKDLKII